MKQIIRDVLDDLSDSQINIASETARETVSNLISAALKSKGSYKEYTDYELDEQKARESWVCSICGENTFDVEDDYIGSGTNHLGCELKGSEEIDGAYTPDEYEGWEKDVGYVEQDNDTDVELRDIVFEKQKQAYLEMTSDGLPKGGDAQAVLESHKLADEIVDNKDEKWIYESPDGGKTVFRRPFADYDPKKKEEIDWETKEPTGRTFNLYPFPEED